MSRRTRDRRGIPPWGGAAVLIAAGTLVAGLVFLYLWQGAILSQLRAERARATIAVKDLDRVRLDLEHEVNRAYSLDEIAERARALGMVPFDERRTRYVVLEEDDH